jgi:hypothetical protein
VTNARSPVSLNPNLDELYRIHDKEPKKVAADLMSMADAGVAPEEHDRFAWLVNHVVGEMEGEWLIAHQMLTRALAASVEAGALRQRAVAALFAGEPLTAWALESRLAQAAGVTPAVARVAVQLGAIQFAPAATPVLELAAPFVDVVDELGGLQGQFGKIAPMLAGGLNNITSRLLDDTSGSSDEATYRRALTEGELARAWRGLGDQNRSGQARAQAVQLAQQFDQDLREWFDSRARA